MLSVDGNNNKMWLTIKSYSISSLGRFVSTIHFDVCTCAHTEGNQKFNHENVLNALTKSIHTFIQMDISAEGHISV